MKKSVWFQQMTSVWVIKKNSWNPKSDAKTKKELLKVF